ncbi:hypothetical protein [Chachezhania sediminis]|uniref:hypothetical protein n=1 Tax=Chachezhania sediminis TaxID=2599291 RepID=UPI00131B8FF3|nr:hypothetical protein [Chachezhania sediminis]
MSDADSFIDEVTEEVRRDRLFALMRRYGWIAILAVVLLVAAAAYNEYRKSAAASSAQALGDAALAAMEEQTPAGRATALAQVADDFAASDPDGAAIVRMMAAGAEAEAGASAAAMAGLDTVAASGALPEIYRQIAQFKALILPESGLDAAERRAGFEALATPGAPLRLLAEEQLALMDIAEGKPDVAIDRLQAILVDADLTDRLQQRVVQVIVALGGTPDGVPGFAG